MAPSPEEKTELHSKNEKKAEETTEPTQPVEPVQPSESVEVPGPIPPKAAGRSEFVTGTFSEWVQRVQLIHTENMALHKWNNIVMTSNTQLNENQKKLQIEKQAAQSIIDKLKAANTELRCKNEDMPEELEDRKQLIKDHKKLHIKENVSHSLIDHLKARNKELERRNDDMLKELEAGKVLTDGLEMHADKLLAHVQDLSRVEDEKKARLDLGQDAIDLIHGLLTTINGDPYDTLRVLAQGDPDDDIYKPALVTFAKEFVKWVGEVHARTAAKTEVTMAAATLTRMRNADGNAEKRPTNDAKDTGELIDLLSTDIGAAPEAGGSNDGDKTAKKKQPADNAKDTGKLIDLLSDDVDPLPEASGANDGEGKGKDKGKGEGESKQAQKKHKKKNKPRTKF